MTMLERSEKVNNNKQTTLFVCYRFEKCFIVECTFNARRNVGAFRYKLHRTECAELKFHRTRRNTKRAAELELRTQNTFRNLLHLSSFFLLAFGLSERKGIFAVQ